MTTSPSSTLARESYNSPPVDLSERCRLPELMDDPNLDEQLHLGALTGLRRVNMLSRSAAILWPTLEQMAGEYTKRTFRVLDIACGGGDVVTSIARKANAAKLKMEIHGCDISERAVEYSTDFAADHGISNCRFFVADALNERLPENYDVVMCSLFLHHLAAEDAGALLASMATACRHAVLVNDLRRTRFGYALAVVGCHLLTRSPIVHTDGPLSVRAAWSDEELVQLTRDAALDGAMISHHWPQRFLLKWIKP